MVKLLGGSDREAREALLACCGSSRWVQSMMEHRPFESLDDLQHAATQAFEGLSRTDWLEAFSTHPRIGERQPKAAPDARAADWSAAEQSTTAQADDDTQAALADANRAYHDRFGHIYLVSAAGRSGEELLADCLARMANDPETELQVAAAELRTIASLRLARLVEESS